MGASRLRPRKEEGLVKRFGDRFGGRGHAGAGAVAVVAVGALACLAINWPGHLSYDSVVQLAEGRSGDYTGAHPPVMSWLLGVADGVSPGAGAFIALQIMMIAGALVSFIALARATPWPIIPIALVLAFTPQLLIYPAIVWKDVLYAASATAGFACLAQAAAAWGRPAWRFSLLAGAALLLALAALTRQNGAIVLPFGALAVCWIAARLGGDRRIWEGLLQGLAFLAVTVLVVVVASRGVAARTQGDPSASQPWEALKTYDIVNALSLAPDMELPILRARAPRLERILRSDGVAAYSPIRADTLAPVLDEMDSGGDSSGLIAAQWQDLVQHHPWLYLRARARTFDWVFLTPDHGHCVLVYTGIDGPAEEMADAGLAHRRTPWDKALARYALSFAPTPIYSHGAYAVLGLVVLGLLLRRRRPPDIAVAAMLGAALAFAASFAVISIACDYRYLYDLDLAVIAGVLYAAATWNAVAGGAGGASLRSPPSAAPPHSRSSRTLAPEPPES